MGNAARFDSWLGSNLFITNKLTTMKQQLLALINLFVQRAKEPMMNCGNGSYVHITDHSLESNTEFSNIEQSVLFNLALKYFKDALIQLNSDITFEVVIKKHADRLWIKNSLIPKEQLSIKAEIKMLMKKAHLDKLENLIEDDPKWLQAIVEERAKNGDPVVVKSSKLIPKL